MLVFFWFVTHKSKVCSPTVTNCIYLWVMTRSSKEYFFCCFISIKFRNLETLGKVHYKSQSLTFGIGNWQDPEQ